MLEATERIERSVAGLDRTAFLADERTPGVVVRNLEILGESAPHPPDDLEARTSDLQRPPIVGLRNRVVHGPLAVDLELVRRIVVNDLPGLVSRLRALRDSLD
ncbi:MAG TPA: DUF86 domain-containing protein [Thermoanaerobaculia bacterium]|jgi:uncharacterized protein with HEPN domain|nr:DUF86 domain-containing protein [Thermoanaerobaculia bacterium]